MWGCGGGGFCCSAPQYRRGPHSIGGVRGGRKETHTQRRTHRGTYTRMLHLPFIDLPLIGNGPNTVSESTVSNTELSEFFGPHRVPGRGLSEFLPAHYLCAKANSPSFFAELTEFDVKLSEAQ